VHVLSFVEEVNTLIITVGNNEWLSARAMVFNATFNNISYILWPSDFLVEETGVPGENHRPVGSYWPNDYRKYICILSI